MKISNSTDIKELLHDRGICVIIPTYNNHHTIGQVVRNVSKFCNDIIVVNDGSTDSTTDILRKIPEIVVVNSEHNKGKGFALRMGFRKALERGFSYAITMDADGQHYAEDILSFLKANIEHPGALVVGCRQFAGISLTKGSAFANKFSNFWFYVQTGCHLKDTQTGYRLYPLKKLYGLNLMTNRYEAELELLVFASWHGVKIVSIPIDVYYFPKGERVSHFRPYKDFGRIFLLNIVLCILAIIYGLPLRLWRGLMTFLRTTYTGFVVIFFAMIVVTPIVWIYIKTHKRSEKTTTFLHNLIYKISRFVILQHGIPGTKFRYTVRDKDVFCTPRVVICNHMSHFDIMCQLIFTPKIVFLTNDWAWNNPFYGLLIHNAEYLSLSEGVEPLLPQLQGLVNRGYSIAVFPEGTRSKNGCIGRFHQGAFYIAKRLGLDILPILLYGTEKVLPKNAYYLQKGLIYLYVDTPLSRAEMDDMGDVKSQTSKVHQLYIHRYNKLKNKIDQYV